jgi:integral membrane protein
MLSTPIGRLRVIAILEGISYLLFAVTMPLKYMLEMPGPNFYVGMAHGWLFMLYIILALIAIVKYKWNMKQTLLTLAASLIPFGTFYADAKLFKPEQKRLAKTA